MRATNYKERNAPYLRRHKVKRHHLIEGLRIFDKLKFIDDRYPDTAKIIHP